ncbi:MAG: hypothetical protein ACFE8Z_11530, partial [Candidatus Hermodarchaeota archaeon]
KQLEKLGAEYESLNSRGDAFRTRLNSLFDEENFDAIATGVGSVMFINVLKRRLKDEMLTGSSLGDALDNDKLDRFQGLLMENGVFGYHGLGALSFSHSEEDLEKTYEAVSRAITALKQAG